MGYLGQKYDKGLVIQRSPDGSAFQENVEITVDGEAEITPKVSGGIKKVNVTGTGGGISDVEINGASVVEDGVANIQLKTISGNPITGTGNVNVPTYLPFDASWDNSTITKLLIDVNADSNAVVGESYLGEVVSVTAAEGLFNGNAEVRLDIMDDSSMGKVILGTVTSADTEPYHWEATFIDGEISAKGWTGYQPKLVSEVNIKTINDTSLLGSGNINIRSGEYIIVHDYSDLPTTNVSAGMLAYVQTLEASYEPGFYQYKNAIDGWQKIELENPAPVEITITGNFDPTQTFTFTVSVGNIISLINGASLLITFTGGGSSAFHPDFFQLNQDLYTSSAVVVLDGTQYIATIVFDISLQSNNATLSFQEIEGGGATRIKYNIEVADDNDHIAFIPIYKDDFDKFLIEMNQVGTALGQATGNPWTNISTIDEFKTLFDDLKGDAQLSFCCDLAVNLLVKYAYESGENPTLGTTNGFGTVYMVVKYNLNASPIQLGYVSTLDIDNPSAVGQIYWFKEVAVGGTGLVDIDSDATFTYTTEQVAGGATTTGKKYYKWELSSEPNTYSGTGNPNNVVIKVDEQTMSNVYNTINDTMTLNISTPQEIITLYNSLKADDLSNSEQTYLLLCSMFGYLAEEAIKLNQPVYFECVQENIIVTPDAMAFENFGAGIVTDGRSWFVNKYEDTTDSTIAFASNSTLTITEETDTVAGGSGGGTVQGTTLYKHSVELTFNDPDISGQTVQLTAEWLSKYSTPYVTNGSLADMLTYYSTLSDSHGIMNPMIIIDNLFVMVSQILPDNSGINFAFIGIGGVFVYSADFANNLNISDTVIPYN